MWVLNTGCVSSRLRGLLWILNESAFVSCFLVCCCYTHSLLLALLHYSAGIPWDKCPLESISHLSGFPCYWEELLWDVQSRAMARSYLTPFSSIWHILSTEHLLNHINCLPTSFPCFSLQLYALSCKYSQGHLSYLKRILLLKGSILNKCNV